MIDIDKLMKGLECCQISMDDANPFAKCEVCPYNHYGISVQDCRSVLSGNCIEVLKQHMEEYKISFNKLIHPDMDAVAKRDAFLSNENGERLNNHIKVFWPDINEEPNKKMTSKEAIEVLSNITFSDEFQGNQEAITAYLMAMDALEEQIKSMAQKTGHWTILEDCSNRGIYCSKCNCKIFDFTHKPQKKLSQYCPHCGSKNEQFFRDGEVVFR